MKICIITEPLMANYGGILQNFALQKFLINHGHEVYTFDVGKFTWFDWIINTAAITLHKLKGEHVNYEKTPAYRKKIEYPLRRFVRKHISTIYPRQHNLNLKCLDHYNIDAFIVGSDQVWRPKYNHDLSDKYLSFTGNGLYKRIAYAASFGTDDWEYSEAETSICRDLAQNFDAISVRERSGVELCSKYFHLNAQHVLDPTMLLDKSVYENLCNGIKRENSFVFAYILDLNQDKEIEIKSFARQFNLPLVLLRAETKINNDDSIEKWLSFFRDSKYVITDSFHGTVFSILFNKTFWVYGNKERGNSRFTSLLNNLELSQRMVEELNQNTDINWEDVNISLQKMRTISSDWMLNNL